MSDPLSGVLDTPCRVLDTHRGVLDSGVLECTPTPCSLLSTPCTLHPRPSTIYLGRPKAARRPALSGRLARLEKERCPGAPESVLDLLSRVLDTPYRLLDTLYRVLKTHSGVYRRC